MAYVNSRIPKPQQPNEAFVKKLLFTKFVHWSYEDEYRAYVSLGTPVGGLYYKDFSHDLALKQVMVGAASKVSRKNIANALGSLQDDVETFKVRAAFRSFRIVQQKDKSKWA